MFSAYVAVGILTAAANGTAATLDLVRPAWLIENMTRVGVPRRALIPLAVLKIAGALGLLIGIGVPPLGVAAAIGLILFLHRRHDGPHPGPRLLFDPVPWNVPPARHRLACAARRLVLTGFGAPCEQHSTHDREEIEPPTPLADRQGERARTLAN